jgi:hypothetical protein
MQGRACLQTPSRDPAPHHAEQTSRPPEDVRERGSVHVDDDRSRTRSAGAKELDHSAAVVASCGEDDHSQHLGDPRRPRRSLASERFVVGGNCRVGYASPREALLHTAASGLPHPAAQIGTYALHRLAAYRDQGSFPGADAAFERALALPFHTRLTDDDLDQVVDALRPFA